MSERKELLVIEDKVAKELDEAQLVRGMEWELDRLCEMRRDLNRVNEELQSTIVWLREVIEMIYEGDKK